MRYLLVFLVLPCLSGPGDLLAQGKRYYVNVASTGANNGLSWTNAFKNLQTALGLAQAGDAVWVAQGTYKPTGAIDRGISFELKSGVQLYGGFAGTESDPAQRDWVLYQTVLDGDIGVPGDSTDNSYNVLYLFEPDSNTLADGLVLRHGSATDPQVAFGIYDRAICGGGLYVMAQDAEGYPTIRNCRFEHNTANNYGGGAMVNGSADGSVAPRFVNCTFESNRSGRNGGGLARLGGSWVGRGIFIDSCTFSANTALQRGGGLFFSGSTGIDSLMFQGSIFEKNYSGLAGGGAFFLLGRPGKSYFSMQGLRFTENTSGDGAALDLFTNGNYFDGSTWTKLFNNIKFTELNKQVFTDGPQSQYRCQK